MHPENYPDKFKCKYYCCRSALTSGRLVNLSMTVNWQILCRCEVNLLSFINHDISARCISLRLRSEEHSVIASCQVFLFGEIVTFSALLVCSTRQ